MNNVRTTTITLTLVILAGHALGAFASWYETLPRIDMILHLAGGMWIGSIVLFMSGRYAPLSFLSLTDRRTIRIVTLGAYVALVALLWEFFEFGVDYLPLLSGNSMVVVHQSYIDTLRDMALGVTGGFIAGLIFLPKAQR